jgi:hypothetical protein
VFASVRTSETKNITNSRLENGLRDRSLKASGGRCEKQLYERKRSGNRYRFRALAGENGEEIALLDRDRGRG